MKKNKLFYFRNQPMYFLHKVLIEAKLAPSILTTTIHTLMIS